MAISAAMFNRLPAEPSGRSPGRPRPARLLAWAGPGHRRHRLDKRLNLLARLRPQAVLLNVADGYNDGRPDMETLALDRYTLLRTDQNGWIEVTTDGERMSGAARSCCGKGSYTCGV